ncbi:hypothetical protein Tco_0786643 [Tanacetum coccineum]
MMITLKLVVMLEFCGVDDGSPVGILLGGVRSGESSSGSGSSGVVDPKHRRRRRSRDAVIVGGGGGDFESDGIGGAIVRGGDFGSDGIEGVIVRGGAVWDLGEQSDEMCVIYVLRYGGDREAQSACSSHPPRRGLHRLLPANPITAKNHHPRTIHPQFPSLPKSPPPPRDRTISTTASIPDSYRVAATLPDAVLDQSFYGAHEKAPATSRLKLAFALLTPPKTKYPTDTIINTTKLHNHHQLSKLHHRGSILR